MQSCDNSIFSLLAEDLELLLDKKMVELIRECMNIDEPYVRASALQVFRLFLSFDSIVSQHGFSQKSTRVCFLLEHVLI